jgi:hypothetical protein
MYAETGNNSRFVLETHGGQVQAATQKALQRNITTLTPQTLTAANAREDGL